MAFSLAEKENKKDKRIIWPDRMGPERTRLAETRLAEIAQGEADHLRKALEPGPRERPSGPAQEEDLAAPGQEARVLNSTLVEATAPSQTAKAERPWPEVYCICRKADLGQESQTMVMCDSCETWYHIQCVNITPREFKALERNKNSTFYCQFCKLYRNQLLGEHEE